MSVEMFVRSAVRVDEFDGRRLRAFDCDDRFFVMILHRIVWRLLCKHDAYFVEAGSRSILRKVCVSGTEFPFCHANVR